MCCINFHKNRLARTFVASRVAQGGRNWEGFGADPFLTGEAAYETILGMQSAGVQATAKHFINKYRRDAFFYTHLSNSMY